MKNIKALMSLAFSLGMMATTMPVAANALYSEDNEIVQYEEQSDSVYSIWFEDIENSTEMLEKFVEVIGIDSNSVTVSEYSPMIICPLTHDQVKMAENCDFVVKVEKEAPSFPANVLIESENTKESIYKILCEVLCESTVDPETILMKIGAEGTEYTLNEDGTMFTCELTEEQVSTAKTCEFVKHIQMATAHISDDSENKDVPSYPADNDDQLVTPPVDDSISVHKILCEVFCENTVDPETILMKIGAEGTEYTLNEDGTMFTCELTEEQVSTAKTCEFVKHIQMATAHIPDDSENKDVPSYPADDDDNIVTTATEPDATVSTTTTATIGTTDDVSTTDKDSITTTLTPTYPAEELPQTGYSNIYKVIAGIASAMTITGTAMIARSKKKDEE